MGAWKGTSIRKLKYHFISLLHGLSSFVLINYCRLTSRRTERFLSVDDLRENKNSGAEHAPKHYSDQNLNVPELNPLQTT